ncbi:MAG: c-type cytochrome [Gemmataceae bacterium]|nr:c-type cytochrome [Gemmata sp.]MDW8197344.1 c-type cytochrome [Gemmataceae bacterium]
MFRLSLVVVSLLAAVAQGQWEAPRTHSVKLNGHTFTLPEGFTIEVAADAQLVPRPIAGDFDDKGRLYVTDSSGSNEKVQVQLEKKPHRILRLEDTNGDGVFDRQTVFVKNIMFPEGCLWYAGSLYVAAPPHILKFTDTNDDGIADKEEIWFDGHTLTGCANDLHGPYRGPGDGYLYWTKGAFAEQHYTLPNGKKFKTRAAHIFRAKPDGSGLEPVMTGGMDNPVDVVFLPNGDLIFSTTFFQHPRNGQRDGLIHAIYGGIYGKDHSPIYDHPWTGPELMPVLTHMGPAAPAGLHRYESEQFGKDYVNNLFCCQFNMRKVSRHILIPKGSSYESRDFDFLVSDNIDFHPTDVIEAADGSLLIVDTGGWYKLCCPTSQLVKPDVTGAIYRVKKIGAHGNTVKPPPPALPRLREIALKRDEAGLDEAIAALRDKNLHTRRLAAEAVGRIGSSKAIAAILEALADERNDRPLDHALTYALIEIGDARETAKGLKHSAPPVRRACLAALSQMSPPALEASAVLAELDAKDPALRETAWWIARRNPQWGGQLAHYFRTHLRAADRLSAAERHEWVLRLVPFTGDATVQQVMSEALVRGRAETQPLVLALMARSGLKTLPPPWRDALLELAPQLTDPELLRATLRVFQALPPEAKDYQAFIARLPSAKLWPTGSIPAEFRLAILAAQPAGQPLDSADLEFLLARLHRDQPAADRSTAVDILLRAQLSSAQLVALTTQLTTVSPLDLMKLLAVFTKSTDEKVGRALIAALQEPAVRPMIRTEIVQPVVEKYPSAVRAAAAKLYAELDSARAGEKAKLDQILAQLKPGDVRRGQLVFNSSKTQCIACHKVGYVGGTVGPDLTKIGTIRSERDLLEAILFPSASFVRSYEPVRVVTTDERVLNGIVKKDAPDELILIVAADKEERLLRADVASIAPSNISLMPAGLEQQLSEQDLADLLAFLKACR